MLKKKKYAIIDHNHPDLIHYMTNYLIRQSPPTLKGTADDADRYMLLEIQENESGLPASSYYWTSDSLETLRELADTYPMWMDYVNYQSRNGGEIMNTQHFNIDSYSFTFSSPLLQTIENALWEQLGVRRQFAKAAEEQGDYHQAEMQTRAAEELEAACMEIIKQIQVQHTPDYLKGNKDL